jgi:hypothetical protein
MTSGSLRDPVQTRPTPPLRTESDSIAWRQVGSVLGLYTRATKESAPRRVAEVQAVANYGLVDDRYASPRSPRQLLIAGSAAYERFNLPPAALRENLLVDLSTEDLRSGDLLRVGPHVVLWMTFQCEPCGLLERRCPGTLKAISTQRGMLARVLRSGTMRNGDTVSLVRSAIPIMSNDWRARVLGVMRRVPPGQFILYRQLAELAGVASAYCRAFPRILSKLPADVASRARGAGNPILGQQWSGSELFDVGAHFD